MVRGKGLLLLLASGSWLLTCAFAQEPIQPTRGVFSEVQVRTNPLPPVSVVSVYTIGVQGGQIYYYWIVAKYGINRPSQDQPAGNATPSLPKLISDAPFILGGSNYVRVCWNPMPGAIGYDVLRTTTSGLPNGAANIGVALNTAGNCVSDTGAPLSSYTLNTYNPAKTPTSLKYARLDMPVITPPLDNPPAGMCRLFVNSSTFSFDAIDSAGASCFASGGGGLPHNLLSTTHPDTLPASVVAGDVVRGNNTPKWERLPKQNNGDILTLVAGLAEWRPPTAPNAGVLNTMTNRWASLVFDCHSTVGNTRAPGVFEEWEVGAISARTCPDGTYLFPYVAHNTTASASSFNGITTHTNGWALDGSPQLSVRTSISDRVAGARRWIGWTGATEGAMVGTDSPTNANILAFWSCPFLTIVGCNPDGGGNIWAVTENGVTANLHRQDTGIAYTPGQIYLFQIFYDAPTTTATFKIDGATVATMNTDMPAAGTNVSFINDITNTSGGQTYSMRTYGAYLYLAIP